MAHFLNDAQYRTLTAICDTLIPAITNQPDPYGFWARSASDLDVPRHFTRRVRDLLDPDQQAQFRLGLSLLDQPLAMALLAGQLGSFANLPPATRERVLHGWEVSGRPELRALFQSFKRLAGALYCSLSDGDSPNPNWPALSYARQVAAAPDQPARTIQPLAITADTTLDCEVVVVGSGAGGGVVAGELARAGHAVVVLEKGGYYAEPDFDGDEDRGLTRLYETHTTVDGAMLVLAGSGLGGGTTINWSAAFATPPHVLAEWESEHGCAGFTGPAFQASLAAVSARVHVTLDESSPSPESLVLERGCAALGYHCAPVPRNARGCGSPPACGACGYGCPRGAKQGTLKTYLQDAADCGARIVTGAWVEQVIIEQGRAAGVRARVGDYTLVVRARVVVAAAGTLHSPVLLARSGVDNPNIGRNLRLHPTSYVFGDFDEPVESWTGVPISRYSTQFADLDGRHYGVVLEHPPAHPGFIGLGLPWRSGQRYKALLSRARHYAFTIAITRDRDPGCLVVRRQGRPRLHYALSRHDAGHLMRGLVESVRIQAAAGAREVSTPHAALEPYRAGQDLDRYLDRLQRVGLAPNRCTLLAAHQMGTCRRGGRRATSVVNPAGESWDVPGLYVADASTFPTPTGVNPMLTIMAVARHTAQGIEARLR
jgi:choline dehydrogenase-like flavoprotein